MNGKVIENDTNTIVWTENILAVFVKWDKTALLA